MKTRADELFSIGDAAQDHGNFDLARTNFETGAALGDGTCMERLAYMFDVGIGVKTNKRLALRLYLRAWRLGSNPGNNIAILYRENGNTKGVVRWFRRAAERGDDGALVELAKLHLSGDGVDRSPEKALRCLDAALVGLYLNEAEEEEAASLVASLRPNRISAKPV